MKSIKTKRYLLSPKEAVRYDEYGFLISPSYKNDRLYNINDHLVPLDNKLSSKCLVILGEPGVGKSNSVKQYKDTLEEESVLYLELGLIGSNYDLEEKIFKVVSSEKSLIKHVILDGLDELRLNLPHGLKIFEHHLTEHKDLYENLQFIITCRSWDWMESTTQVLKGIYTENELDVLELLPFTKENVEDFLGEFEIKNKDGFFKQLKKSSCSVFANKPINLIWLINIFKEENQINKTVSELYKYGILKLLDENNPNYSNRSDSKKLSDDEQLIVAGKLAFGLSVTSKNSVQKPNYEMLNSEALTLNEVSLYKEEVGKIEKEISINLYQQVLSSGLFSLRGENAVGFIHKTLQEYLAAYYINSHKLSEDKIFKFIASEVLRDRINLKWGFEAGWLALQNNKLCELLIEKDSIAFFQYLVALPSEKYKKRLFSNLLSKNDELQNLRYIAHQFNQYDFENQISKIVFDGIEKIIINTLETPSQNPWTIWFCTEIIEALKIQDACKALEGVFVNSNLPIHIRRSAYYALRELNIDEISSNLKEYLLNNKLEDSQDQDIRGGLLELLWPKYISIKDVIRSLEPVENDSYFGVYRRVLNSFVSHISNEDDWVTFLQWLNSDSGSSHFIQATFKLVEDILMNITQHLKKKRVLEEFSEFITNLDDLNRVFSGHREENQEKINFLKAFFNSNQKLRKSLLKKVIQKGCKNNRHFYLKRSFEEILRSSKDIDFYIKSIKASSSESEKITYSLIIRSLVYDNIHSEEYLKVKKYYDSPNCDSTFKSYLACIYDNNSDLYNQLEQLNTNTEEKKNTPSLKTIKSILKNKDKLYVWPSLFNMISEDPYNTRNYFYNKEFVSTLPEKTLDSLIALAKSHVIKHTPDGWKLFRASQVNLLFVPTLRFLASQEPHFFTTIKEEIWEKWTPAIILHSFLRKDTLEDQIILEQLNKNAEPFILEVLKGLKEEQNKHDIHYDLEKVFDYLSKPFSTKYFNVLKNILMDSNIPNRTRLSLGRELLSVDKAQTVSLLKSFTENSIGTKDTETLSKVAAFTLLLLESEVNNTWKDVWHHIEKNEILGKEVAYILSDEKIYLSEYFSEKELGAFYKWIISHYPSDEDPVISGARYYGFDDTIRDFRDKILTELSQFGNAKAYSVIQDLKQDFPNEKSILEFTVYRCFQAEQNKAIRLNDALRYLKETNARIINNDYELLELVLEALDSIQKRIFDRNSISLQFWHRQKNSKDGYIPYAEDEFSTVLCELLQYELGKYGLISVREEQIFAYTKQSPRTDITVYVKNSQEDLFGIVIESKCNWNDNLFTEMENQLVNIYLKDLNTYKSGIYLVACYPSDRKWVLESSKKSKAAKNCFSKINKRLENQAKKLTIKGTKQVKHYVLKTSLMQNPRAEK